MEKSLEERVKALEEQIRRHEAVNEIRKVMAKYTYTMDSGDYEGVMSCYAKECQADFGSFGSGNNRAEVEAFYHKHFPAHFNLSTHRITNEIIDVKDENTAFGMWYLDEACILQETKAAAWIGATYYVDFVKEDGKWLFKSVIVRNCRFVTDYDKGWAREPYAVDPGSVKERRTDPL